MTEDQKAISLILDLLNVTRQVPRTRDWIETEVKLAGRKCDVATLLEAMADEELVEVTKDGLKIKRYTITLKGREVLDSL
ncbi:MAG: hypothetical protein ABIS50_15175 [Luteolibacter sp.]|uniref:hypothetical protein n=1 Tax=Luteolibacter sp. TaxID=1962973 RepID=UPI003265E577